MAALQVCSPCAVCWLHNQPWCGRPLMQCPTFNQFKLDYLNFKRNYVGQVQYTATAGREVLKCHTTCGITAVRRLTHDFITDCRYADKVYPIAYCYWRQQSAQLAAEFNTTAVMQGPKEYGSWLMKVEEWPYSNAQRVLLHATR